jgi:zinc protease
MKRNASGRRLAVVFSSLLMVFGMVSASDVGADLEIAHRTFTLDNGLTLIVHEDHKAPIVAVNIWYHVGSKNEKVGKTGFAHLFEHLMFNGSEHSNDDYFQGMERLGATDLNGTTNEDRTNYFQNVPRNALDAVLWYESDRMGHLLGAIDQARLDEQRGVVQNEKRQGQNQPYSKFWDLLIDATYPAGHPYSHSVIGSLDDLDAASLDDVKEWFQTYYGAANAVLVVAGDVDTDDVLQRVNKYFGDIAPGPPIAKFKSWVAKRTDDRREMAYDRVPQARVYKVWNVPQFGTGEAIHLDLLSNILTSGKTSRLYKRLVYEDQIATSVSSFIDDREIAGQFHVWATAKPGGDLDAVEAVVNEELARILKDGPTAAEMERAKTQILAGFIRGAERIGGFGGKSDVLARFQINLGDSNGYKNYLDGIRNATADDLKTTAAAWLADGTFTFQMLPFPDYKAATEGADRTSVPVAGKSPEASFPTIQQATLKNGLKVLLAERHSVPVVGFNLLIDAGYTADQISGIPGTASLAMNMLDEGTMSLGALEIAERQATLGANIGAGSSLDTSSVSLSALKANLDDSLDLYVDVILNPSFPEKELERLKRQQIAGIQREKSTPIQMALRIFPKLMYGEGHAYANPFTGSGFIEGVSKLTAEDLSKFHSTWFKPNNATLVVVGDTTMEELKGKLEKAFRSWKKGEVPTKDVATVALPSEPSFYLIDRPGSQQSIILAGHVALPMNNPQELAIETANQILGGSFTSRVNMNLREDKHWSYGARTILVDAKGQRPFFAYAPVQTDKTAESMVEVRKEIEQILAGKPITMDELAKIQANRVLRLPGSWETSAAVSGSIQEIVNFDLPMDYWSTYSDAVRGLKLESVQRAVAELLAPEALTWIVVGDLAQTEEKIRALGWGKIVRIDVDGNVIE